MDAAAFDSVLARILTTIFEDEGSRAAGASVAEAVEALGGSRERAETFLRYDSSGDGRIDLGEAVAMALSLGGALDAFLVVLRSHNAALVVVPCSRAPSTTSVAVFK